MRVTLEVTTGTLAGNKIRLKAGQVVRLGRTSKADFAFPDDSHMSGVHFLIECDEKTCRLRDLGSRNGTAVNGRKVGATELVNGDTILAGETNFLVKFEGEAVEVPAAAAVAEQPAAVAPEDRLLVMLRKDFQPLYALLDAARSPDIYKLLVESRQQSQKFTGGQGSDTAQQPRAAPVAASHDSEAPYESLFEGTPKAELTHFAPYLVRLPPEAKLLEKLVLKGWGKSWGVYLTCDKPLKEVRTHFRRFLMVKLPDNRQVYFRYYDPRVLRLFLPTCTAEEINMFFGPVKYYLMEDEKPDVLLRFSNKGQGAGLRAFPLLSEGGRSG